MKKLIIFFTIRVLDLFSTWLVINKYGGGAMVEGNPFYKYIIGNYGYGATIIINLIISLFIYKIFTLKKLRKAFFIVIGIMGLTVIWNFGVYFLIWEIR